MLLKMLYCTLQWYKGMLFVIGFLQILYVELHSPALTFFPMLLEQFGRVLIEISYTFLVLMGLILTSGTSFYFFFFFFKPTGESELLQIF